MFGRMMAAPTALGGGVGAVAGAADAAAGYKAEGTDHAFRSQLDDAAKQFAALQAVERELKDDDVKFQREIAGYRQTLDNASQRLAKLNATKERLHRELLQCKARGRATAQHPTPPAAIGTSPSRLPRRRGFSGGDQGARGDEDHSGRGNPHGHGASC